MDENKVFKLRKFTCSELNELKEKEINRLFKDTIMKFEQVIDNGYHMKYLTILYQDGSGSYNRTNQTMVWYDFENNEVIAELVVPMNVNRKDL